MQRWNGDYFTRDSLQNLGLRYQVGHSGGRCPCPEPGPKNFVVFDISGPHWISIDYCRCDAEPLSNWVQLLREKWFPATLTRPQTVFSFDCLKTFHELTLQGKTSLYDYYHTLLRRSDNANLNTPIVNLITFFSMVPTDLFLCRTDILRFIGFSECGGTWWLSNEVVGGMIREVLILRVMENSWSRARLVHIQAEIYRMIGRKRDLWRKFSLFYLVL